MAHYIAAVAILPLARVIIDLFWQFVHPTKDELCNDVFSEVQSKASPAVKEREREGKQE